MKTESFTCDVCGKQLKTAAGLAGHKQFAHPPLSEVAESTPEQALAEMLEAVGDAYQRLERRLSDSGSQIKSLAAQLATVDEKLKGYQVTRMDEAKLAEDTAKLQQDYAKLEEENKSLETEANYLRSDEHENEVVAEWLNEQMADPERKVELGRKLGLYEMFNKAEVEEEKEPVPAAEVKEPEAPKPEVVYDDPGDNQYHKVEDLNIWVLQK